jgi:NAD(P)H-nitrite reductase large subunit
MEMMTYDYLIIGGGIAGVSAAETLRELEGASQIGIVSNEPHILYSRVLLPSYLKNRIPREQLFLRHEDDFTAKRIDVHLGGEAAFVDIKRREVLLKNGMRFGYGKLLLSAGGQVRAWGETPEENQDIIYRLHTLDDADRLKENLDAIRDPIVIGGSFIALEFLEIFVLNRLPPLLLCKDQGMLNGWLEGQGSDLLSSRFRQEGIVVQFGDAVKEIQRKESGMRVITNGLRQFSAGAIALGIGIERNLTFLKDSGIELGKKGIRTSEFLETNIPGVFAAGDIAEFFDAIKGEYRALGNWTNAVLQGKCAAKNMAGVSSSFRSVSGYSISNFGLHITILGDYEGADESIVRVEPIQNRYERLFLRKGILTGAALINRFQDKPYLSRLIETRTPLGEETRRELRNPQFDIRQIPVVG